MKKLFLFPVLFLFSICSFGQTPEFWGMTSKEGGYGAGVVFKTNGNGNNQSITHDFFMYEGRSPEGSLIEASNGKLYGLTKNGGSNGTGILFKYDPATNTYVKKFEFNGTSDGGNPRGSLIEASNGKLYGMTYAGGLYGAGVLFEYDYSTESYTKKIDFDGTNKGSRPYGSLMEASNGKLYGMTYQGGSNNRGVLFEYDPSVNTYTKKVDFDGTNMGGYPYGGLTEAPNGKLYGLTNNGGAFTEGVLFEYDPSISSFSVKLDFDGTNKGSHPRGSLTLANGKLYGMTYQGGVNNLGVLFEYDHSTNSYNKKVDFDGATKGRNPRGSLIQSSNGKLYGMTLTGGVNNQGVIFEYDLSTDTYAKNIDLNNSSTGNGPHDNLIEASNGKLYGMTYWGGSNGRGVMFEYNPNTSTYIKKVDFEGTYNGKSPYGSFLELANGRLYGITSTGGDNNNGVLFEYDPSIDTIYKKIDFDGTNKGSQPYGSLIEASNGKLYGMTSAGGINNNGVLFEYDPITDTYSKKIDFDGTNKGRFPNGSLVEASNGKLYGMTRSGGVNNYGVLFEYNPSTNVFTKRFDFDGAINGNDPEGSLVEASNGKLYGMTSQGGNNSYGVLFEYDPSSNVFTKKLEFNNTNGRHPYGSLIEVSNGSLYGMTLYGGSNSKGVLFEYDPSTNVINKLIDFDGTNKGSHPYGSLMEASNGNLYGMTRSGGVNNLGTLFEYDPSTNIYNKKLDFNGANGGNPHGNLIEVNPCYTSNTLNVSTCDSYTVPSGNNTYSTSGTYIDQIPNAAGCDSVLTINLTINNSNTGSETVTACDSYTWPANGNTYTSSGAYNATLTNAAGCDSVVTLNLTVNSSTASTQSITACNTYTVPSGDETHTTSGTYMDTIPNAAGCDSLLTINLTINNSNTGSETVTACDSYTWPTDGIAYNSSGAYTTTLTNQVGCDSVVTLNLTINQSTAHAINPVACDSYTVPSGDETYTSSGTVMDTLTNAAGCDSVLTINLTINNSNTGSETVSACDSYTWPANSTTYTSSGAYTATLTNQVGCDSVVTLNLTIKQSTAHAINPVACDSYTVPSGDETYSSSGLYNDTIPNAVGCDSILTINLVVNNSSSSNISETACGSYTVPSGNETYTSSGMVMDTIPNTAGCDSVMTINLTINNADTTISKSGTTLTSNATGATYQWLDCDNNYSPISNATNQSYTATSNGNYAVKVTQSNCTDTSFCYNVNSVGVSEKSGVSDVNVYPNPNTGQFMIDLRSPYENVEITIRDLRGKVVYREVISQQTVVPLNLEDKAEGVYLINVNTGTEQFIKKLVIH